MRITVYDVLLYLAAGMTPEEIVADFPYLTEEDIRAYLSYAADRERLTLIADTEITLRPDPFPAPRGPTVG